MRLRVLIVVAVAAGVFAAAGRARADALAELDKAYSAYVAHKYDDAETRLRALLDAKSLDTPDNVADARMYLGAVLVAEKRKDDADKVFEQLLTDKVEYEPDRLRVSLDAINEFIDVRARLRDKLAAIQAEKVRKAQEEKAKIEAEQRKAALRLAMLEKFASEEVVIEKNSRWLALVPFGVGQFQNGQRAWGWVFLTTESALLLGSGVAAGVSYFDQLKMNDAFQSGDYPAANTYRENARRAALVDYGFAIGFAATAVVGVVLAETSFLPERTETRKRDLPPLSIAPVVGPTFLGARGSF